MDFDTTRRYTPHPLSFPSYYYNDRNVPLALAHGTRPDPRGYPIGGPVRVPQGRPVMGSNEPTHESGPARRRIAIACARCRKRKIRCSGDPANGSGCTNCKQAGVDATQCQFHRVGSDHVHKVIDNFHMAHPLTGMANGNGMMPMYTAATHNPIYSRPMTAQPHQFPQSWTIPYNEDTSPVDTYTLEQSGAYLPNPAMYGSSNRWTHPTTKSLHHGQGAYYDPDSSYSAHGLPYIHTNNTRSATTNEALSPLNMSSLQLTLPERPHPRQYYDSAAPQRQLPIPQPSPAQTSRNVVDQMQDQRLRSGQAMGPSSVNSGGTFAKPLLPWSLDSDNPLNVSQATSAEGAAMLPATTDGDMSYLAATSSADDAITTSTAPASLNFSTSALLDAMSPSAPVSTYSNFRESRRPEISAAHMARQSSQSNLYSFNSDSAGKRHSHGSESSNDATLVSGHRYTPLAHSQPQASPHLESLQREVFETRNNPLHRASMSNLNSSF